MDIPMQKPTSPTSPLTDAHGRTAAYLRVSLTDRCNLRCMYCSSGRAEFIPHGDILRYEEIERVIGVLAQRGIGKVRFTGGEPLARKGAVDFLERLAERHPALDLRLTTNGTLLRGVVPRLARLGMSTVNISLDTLRPERFKDITGFGKYADVRRAIDDCLAHGLRVKLNAVALAGVNTGELADFVELARTQPIDVRFIEFMPMGASHWTQRLYMSSKDILATLRRHAQLVPATSEKNHGPARMYSIAGGAGRIGVISALSNHFCSTCNRLRLTSDGALRTCLYSDNETPLRGLLRTPGVTDADLHAAIARAVGDKPLGYRLLQHERGTDVSAKGMAAIGG